MAKGRPAKNNIIIKYYDDEINSIKNNNLKNKIEQWVNNNAGGYGPDKDDEIYMNFKNEMDDLLQNTLEDFIENAIDVIAKYTINYYGDSTSFSPEDIKNKFYKYVK